jgi:hypothetical protein
MSGKKSMFDTFTDKIQSINKNLFRLSHPKELQ